MRSALTIALLLMGCPNAPSKTQCEQLLNNVIDIQIKAAGANTPETKADLDKQKKKLKDAMQKEFMKDCLENLPKDQVECGIKVKSMDDLKTKCEK